MTFLCARAGKLKKFGEEVQTTHCNAGHKVGDDEAGLPTYLDSVSSFYLEHRICVKHHH
jgi:hypothetical protein